MDKQQNQSAWSRGWDDTKSGWSDWRFWLAELFIGGIVAMIDTFLGLAFVAVIAVGIWIGATVRAPVR